MKLTNMIDLITKSKTGTKKTRIEDFVLYYDFEMVTRKQYIILEVAIDLYTLDTIIINPYTGEYDFRRYKDLKELSAFRSVLIAKARAAKNLMNNLTNIKVKIPNLIRYPKRSK